MSRHHHVSHPDRSKSNYPKRLQARGLSHAPTMEDLDTLRKRQERRYQSAGSPWPDLWQPTKPKIQGILDATYGGNWYGE